MSTTLFARLLKARGGTITAVEHDAAWAEFVSDQLRAEGLDGVATVVHAPLKPHPASADELPWDAAEPIAGVAGGDAVDLLIVDGPPAYASGAGLARLPALPALADRLTLDAAVVLDDIVPRESRTFSSVGNARRRSASSGGRRASPWADDRPTDRPAGTAPPRARWSTRWAAGAYPRRLRSGAGRRS